MKTKMFHDYPLIQIQATNKKRNRKIEPFFLLHTTYIKQKPFGCD